MRTFDGVAGSLGYDRTKTAAAGMSPGVAAVPLLLCIRRRCRSLALRVHHRRADRLPPDREGPAGAAGRDRRRPCGCRSRVRQHRRVPCRVRRWLPMRGAHRTPDGSSLYPPGPDQAKLRRLPAAPHLSNATRASLLIRVERGQHRLADLPHAQRSSLPRLSELRGGVGAHVGFPHHALGCAADG
jgi:hypothetical protein